MLRLLSPRPVDSHGKVVALFGIGLIGSAIRDSLLTRAGFREEALEFDWAPGPEQDAQAERVAARVRDLLRESHGDAPSSLAVIWSAGRCGFSASSRETELELLSFQAVLNMTRGLFEAGRSPTVHVHLISSAGGLFDGAGHTTLRTRPCPQRPYGRSKQRQEDLLHETASQLDVTIYRPTSVYGVPRAGERRGLVQTLIERAVRHEVSTIFGELSTLRDFVFAEDLGAFVADRVLRAGDGGGPYLLGSGKPSSILEVIRLVEKVLRRRIYVSLVPDPAGAGDITFSANLHPPGWSPIDLETGIRAIHHRWASSGPPFFRRERLLHA